MNSPARGESASVVIADDHDIVREAIRELLTSPEAEAHGGYNVVAIAENGLEAIAAIKAHRPNLIFLDISMPLASGVEIIHDIRRWSADTKIAVFTGITSAGLLALIVESGVDGLFSKSTSTTQMLDKLPLILRGGRFVAEEFLDLIRQGQKVETLTARERQVMNMVVSGKTNKEIAGVLNISPKTVEKHRTCVMRKLEVHSVAQLMARALKDGLIDAV